MFFVFFVEGYTMYIDDYAERVRSFRAFVCFVYCIKEAGRHG